MATDALGPALHAMLDVAPEAAMIVDGDGVVVLWNRAATALLGWTDVVGRPDPSVPEGDRAASLASVTVMATDAAPDGPTVVTRLREDGAAVDVVITRVTRVELADGAGLAVWFGPASPADARFVRRNRFARRLVEATRAEEVEPVLLDALHDLLGADAGVVLRRCPSGEHLHGLWGIGVSQGDAEAIELGVDDTSVAAVLEERIDDGRLVVAGVEHHARFVPMGPSGDGWALAVLSPARADHTTDAYELALAVADETWIALQRARLVDELDAKIEILEATTALAASVGLHLDDALVAVTTQAAEALSCERAAVYLLDEDGGALALAHVHASDAAPAALLSEGEGLALAAEVVGAARQVLYQDVSSCEAADGPWHADAGAVAVLGLPLQVAGRTIGALVLAHTVAHPRGFTTLCLQVGAAVAQQAALAFDHARLFEAEQRTVRRLRELDRMKADWMAGLTHDLKAPLTGLLGFVETLRRLTGHVSAEQQREFLSVMARQADQLVALVEDLLLSARIDADAVARRRELLGVDDLVQGAVASLSPEQRERLEVVGDGIDSTVLVDKSHMLRVLQNLLSNGFRHGGEQVRLTTSHEDGHVVIDVDDDGPGVDVELRDRIFDRFAHGETAGATGLGLYVARGIAVAHDGSLTVSDAPGGGARFTLRLPRSRQQREEDLDDLRLTKPPVERRQPLEVDGIQLTF